MLLNRRFNAIHTKHGYPYWSLAGHIKTHIRGANDAIAHYRQAAITRAKKENVEGIVCGHIHPPEIMTIDGITYYNYDDCVESFSALTDDKQGNIRLIFWSEEHVTKLLATVESSPKTEKEKQAA